MYSVDCAGSAIEESSFFGAVLFNAPPEAMLNCLPLMIGKTVQAYSQGIFTEGKSGMTSRIVRRGRVV